MKAQFLVGVVDTIRITIYDNNISQIPTSAKITLYKPDGGELQALATASIDATTGELTYALSAIHTATADLNYKAIWKYTIGGVDFYQTQLFDIVKSLLSIPITDDDLYNELESLRKTNYQASSTATSSSSSTLVDTKRKEADDFWIGGNIEIVSGTGVGQKRVITDYVQSTGTFTINSNWASNPDTTSVYVVTRSYTKKIQSAFDTFCTMLYDKGKRHQLILESSQISQPMIYLTIHMIALDLMDETDDKWDRLSKVYIDKFDKSFSNMKLDYDEDDSGTIGEEEAQQSQTSIRIGRA